MAKPNSTSWMIGMPTIMAKRQPVAPHLDQLLEEDGDGCGRSSRSARWPRRFIRRLAHQLDEDVLEAGRLAGATCDGRSGRQRRDARVQSGAARRGRPRAAYCRTTRPDRCRCRGGHRAGAASPVPSTGHDGGSSPELLDDLVHRAAARGSVAVGDIDDAVAALGLVHVVRRDEHRQPWPGEQVDLLPEFAPRLRIDAGRRLVEQTALAAGA